MLSSRQGDTSLDTQAFSLGNGSALSHRRRRVEVSGLRLRRLSELVQQPVVRRERIS